MGQLDLFATPPVPPQPEHRADPGARLAETHAAAAAVAAFLPPSVRFGTSSWSFPGWVGLVYAGPCTQRSLARDGLAEYARHPLLRTVGIDRSFYAPVPESDWRRYADQLPQGFPCCAKAPASVSSPLAPGPSPRRSPGPNPTFLSADRFIAEVLDPVERVFASHAGPFVFEISPTPREASLDPAAFAERLDSMLESLPRAYRYAVELRDPRLLTDSYARVLARHRAGHVYNYWSAMPMPGVQAARVPAETAAFCVVRLLLKPGTWYEQQRERFRPFDRLVEPSMRMRADVTDLVASAVAAGREAFVLVNNKAEGSAPLTIVALAERLAGRLQPKRAASQANPSSSGGAM